MKLNHSELRQIFLLNIKENTPKTRVECPSPKQMLRLFRGKISDKKKAEIIDHITSCSHCVHEFEFIIKALRFENDMRKAVQKSLRTKKTKPVSPRFSWKLAPLLTGLALICVMVITVTITESYKSQKFRTITPSQIRLFQPHEKTIHKSSLHFHWQNIKDFEYYTFELYDDTLYQIWNSGKLYKNSYILSEDISSRLETNKTYFWMISAFSPNGRKIESPLKEIFLIE